MLPRATIITLFLLLSCSVSAESISVSGVAPGAEGEIIEVFRYWDMLTSVEEVIEVIVIGADGRFSFNTEIGGTSKLYLRYGVFDLFFFAVPGEEYELTLPSFRAKSEADLNNPYFRHIEYQLATGNEENLNNNIRVFDSVYQAAIEIITTDMYYRRVKNNYDSLVINLESFCKKRNDDYYNIYTTSRILSLKYDSKRRESAIEEATLFLNKNFSLDNSAYSFLVEKLFGEAISRMLSGSKSDKIRTAVNFSSSTDDLREIVGNTYKISDEGLLDYIILLNLYKEYYLDSFSKDGVYRTLLSLNSSCNEAVKLLSARAVDKISRLKTGNIPPQFSLADERGNHYNLDSLKGKIVILTFGNSASWLTLSEYSLLRSWNLQYQDNLDIVTILIDTDFPEGLKKMRKEGFTWLILDGSNNPDLLNSYEIRFLPTFVLLDSEGRIISAPAPFPSENLRNLFLEQLQRDLIEDIRN